MIAYYLLPPIVLLSRSPALSLVASCPAPVWVVVGVLMARRHPVPATPTTIIGKAHMPGRADSITATPHGGCAVNVCGVGRGDL